MTTTPPPRPALHRSSGGVVSAVTVPRSTLAVDQVDVDGTAGKKVKKKDKGDDIELAIVVSRRVRKKLRRKADRYGWSAEQAAAYVLRTWADQ